MNAPLVIPQFVPVRMAKGCRDKQRRAAAKFRNLLCDVIAAHGTIGARELADLTGSKIGTVRDYLTDLMLKGVICAEKVKGKNHATGGTLMFLYSMADDEGGPSIGAKQRTVTKWQQEPIKHEPVLAAFFGINNNEGMI